MKIDTYFHLAHILILEVNGKLIEYMYNVMYKVQ